MPMIVECPSCGKKLKIPDDLVGKTVRCSDCAGTFLAERPRSAAPLPPPLPPAEYQERPSHRRSQLTQEGMMPHRGGLVMAFGIIAAVMVLLSGGVYVGGAVAGPVAFGGLPVTIIGLVLGILAWIWGGRDLALMKAGIMDPAGHGMTTAGYICGIIGAILNAIGLILGCVAAVLVLIFGIAIFGGWACCMFSAMKNAPPPQKFPPPRRIDIPAPMRLQDYFPPRS
jgi:hypothetical protein